MALWQFDCMIIPDRNISLNIESDEILSWKGINISAERKEILESILSFSKGWSKNVLVYGKEGETCIRLRYECETLDEVMLRLDLRSLTRESLLAILEFMKSIKGNIFYNRRIYLADISVVIPLLRESEAGKFCMSPQKYFEELEHKEL